MVHPEESQKKLGRPLPQTEEEEDIVPPLIRQDAFTVNRQKGVSAKEKVGEGEKTGAPEPPKEKKTAAAGAAAAAEKGEAPVPEKPQILKKKRTTEGSQEKGKKVKTLTDESKAKDMVQVCPVQTKEILIVGLCATCAKECQNRVGIHKETGQQYVGIVMCEGCVKKNKALHDTFSGK